MIYLPVFSIGSKVETDSGEVGVIVGIDGGVKVDKDENVIAKTHYFVKMDDDSIKKIHETRLKDVKKIKTEVEKAMDEFLADTLLLSRPLDPERVDCTVKELLQDGGED